MQENPNLKILHDHYNNSFAYLHKYIEKRDRLFLTVLTIVAFIFLIVTEPELAVKIGENILNDEANSTKDKFIILQLHVFKSALLIALLFYLLNYFRIIGLISYQMKYIGQIEKKMNDLIGEEAFITREGEAYRMQPKGIRKAAQFIYKFFFPTILIILVVIQGFQGKSINDFFSKVLYQDVYFYLDISLCLIIIYLIIKYMLQSKSNNHSNKKQ